MAKRVTFSNNWLAAVLVAPQLLLVAVFFYWPSGEALYWSLTLEPPFGGSNEWVGLLNFQTVFGDANYWSSVRVSVLFALLATGLSLIAAMVLALFVDRRLPGHQLHKFTYFLPYALAAPAVGLAFVSSSRPTPVSSPRSTGSFPICGIRRSTARMRWRSSSSPKHGKWWATTSCSSSPGCSPFPPAGRGGRP